ncbi:MAG TPA: hypothetical protein V6D28_01810 [Leptolyngbyaceae cyanobacterium]
MPLYYQYARKALWAFLIYLPFVGTLAYTIGGGNPLFQFTKDVFYFPALIALLFYCYRQNLPIFIAKPLKWPLLGLLLFSLLTFIFINGDRPSDPDLGEQPFLMGIIGLKALIGYIPLIFCAYYLIRSQKELRFFIRLHVVLALICCTLAFIQYLLLLNGRCIGTSGLEGDTLFKASLDARCFVGGALLFNPELGLIRLPGTFATPWHWAWFLIANAFAIVGAAVSETSRKWRNISFLAMTFLLVTAIFSGQRTALVMVPIILMILLFVAAPGGKIKQWIMIDVSLIVLFVLAAKTNFLNLGNYLDIDWFSLNQFSWVISELQSILGNGLGRATNAARIFGEVAIIDNYYAKILYEIGLVGLLAFLVVIATLIYLTFKAYRSIKNRKLRCLAVCLWGFVLFIGINPIYYPLDLDPVAIYYWFFAGVLLKLPQLDSLR